MEQIFIPFQKLINSIAEHPLLSAIVVITITIAIVALFFQHQRKKANTSPHDAQDPAPTTGTNTNQPEINSIIKVVISLDEYGKNIKKDIKEKNQAIQDISQIESKTTENQQRIKILSLEKENLELKYSNLEQSFEEFKNASIQHQQELDSLRDSLPETIITQVKEYIASGAFEEADALLDKATTAQTQQLAHTLFVQAQINEDALNYEKAYALYIRASTLEPDNTTYLNDLGMLTNTLDKHQEALAHYTNVLEIDLTTYKKSHPEVTIRKNNIGLIYDLLEKYDKVLIYCNEALETLQRFFDGEHSDVQTL